MYEPTAAGRVAHTAWLRAPVDAATVSPDLGLHLMRFAMMEHEFSREEVLGFLADLRDALTAFVADLERSAAEAAQSRDRHPALALDHGLAVHRASLRSTQQTIAALRSTPLVTIAGR